MACEYCTKFKCLKPTESTPLIDVSIIASDGWVPTITVGSLFAPRRYYPINYCPMCGRDLRGDTHE